MVTEKRKERVSAAAGQGEGGEGDSVRRSRGEKGGRKRKPARTEGKAA